MANASAGILAKASLVGAKTVNGPLPLSVSTKPAACTAATRVDKSGVAIAASTIVGLCLACIHFLLLLVSIDWAASLSN